MRFITTPAFCKADLLELCLKNLYHSPIAQEGFTHVVIDGHYPIDQGKNRRRIHELCEEYGITCIDPGLDLGLHGNLNYAVNAMSIGPQDTMINVDPDDFPEPGSILKLAKAMEANPRFSVIAMNFCLIKRRIAEGKLQAFFMGDQVIYIHPTVEMFKVAAFNMGFIHSLPNKFHEPWNYYGGLESYLYSEWNKQGLKLGYIHENCQHIILDIEDTRYFDRAYRFWKKAHLGGFSGSFEQWLTSGVI